MQGGIRPGYKQTEVGVIPEDWTAMTIASVGHVQTGSTPPTSQRDLYDGDFLFVGPSDIGERKYIAQSEKTLSLKGFKAARTFPAGSSLFVCIGSTIGKIGLAAVDLTSNQQINAVTPGTQVDAEYLYYSLLLASARIASLAGEQAVPIINKSSFSANLITIPPLPEQRAIAAALSDADALIAALEGMIAKKRDLKQAAMQHLLTGKTRLPGFSGEWEVKRLGEVAFVFDGTHQTPSYVLSGIPFYSVEHVTSGDFSNTKFITPTEHKFLTRTVKIERGDILMTRIGSIGDCKLVDWEVDASFYVSLALLKIRPGTSARYIEQYSKTRDFQIEIEMNSLMQAIPKKINLGPISRLAIRLPSSLEEQTAIAEVLSDMDADLAALEAQAAKARAVKQGMMQELLTGRVRLV